MKEQATRVVALALGVWAACWPAQAQQTPAGSPTPAASPATLANHAVGTPEEHFRLTEYFQDLAVQEQSLARSYDRLARFYEQKALPPDLTTSVAREMKNQFLRLAETERKAAGAAASLAAYHARLAEHAERLPAAAKPLTQDSAFRR